MNKHEYDFYFGIYERTVGYNIKEEISYDELAEKIKQEQLDMYSTIEFYPKNLSQANMVALIKNTDKYGVLKTGEKGSGTVVNFKNMNLALNYMLACLRLKKEVSKKSLADEKNKQL